MKPDSIPVTPFGIHQPCSWAGKGKTTPTLHGLPRKQKPYSLSDPRQELQPSLGITLPRKVTMSPGDTDRSFRHQPNLMPATMPWKLE